MKSTPSDILPAPPGLLSSLIAGFDAITTHIGLIFFPIALDLLLWLGPHFKITQLVESFASQISSFPGLDSPDAAQMLQANQDIWKYIAERIDLLAALRSYPVGIPSLMSGRLPVETPLSLAPLSINIFDVGSVLGWVVLFSFIGLIVGSLYFESVAVAVIPSISKRFSVIRAWPKAALNVILLTLIWGLIFVAISIPGSCILSALALGSPTLAQIGLLLFGGAAIWLLLPLFFSPHGIFVYQDGVAVSLRKGVRVVQSTLPTTGMLLLAIIIISQGLDLLWNSPAETSWLTLVGIIGHAFVTTGLLAATFIYYWKADQWIQAVQRQLSETPSMKVNI